VRISAATPLFLRQACLSVFFVCTIFKAELCRISVATPLFLRQACLSVFLFALFSKRSFVGLAQLSFRAHEQLYRNVPLFCFL
jgi:hypothetical protein